MVVGAKLRQETRSGTRQTFETKLENPANFKILASNWNTIRKRGRKTKRRTRIRYKQSGGTGKTQRNRQGFGGNGGQKKEKKRYKNKVNT